MENNKLNCENIMKTAYDDELTIINGVRIWLHTLFCSECAQKIELYHSTRAMMRNNFFPPSPDMEDTIMSKIAVENTEEEPAPAAGVFSLRSWVIVGLLIIISFVTAFLGMDFKNVASETGTSFMLPVGILFGIVLTTYCAMFIGSHLKELTERFGL